MKSKWKLWLIPVVLIVAFSVFKGGASWDKKEIKQDVAVPTVATRQVSKVNIENSLSVTGSIEAFHQAVIFAKVPSGRVSKVAVQNGDRVAAGQSLIYLESQSFANTLKINQATLKKAETGLATARSDYQRFQELYQQGAVSQKEFEDKEAAVKLAEAEASSAAAAVATAEEDLQNSTITSPIAGLVANRSVTTGQMVSPQGSSLMSVEDLSSVYVVVNIEQKDLSMIKPGLKADVTVDAYGNKKFTGVVEVVNPVAKKEARVFETKIKVDNKDILLKPGMFAKVQIKIGETKEVLTVPQAALASKQGMYFVFLPNGDKVKRQQVEIGQIINQLVEVKSGLSEGQQVVVTNVNKLKDQDKVKIAK
ncbi:efflux transporter, RND family, MFP subunit [Desulforamulus reducens MI-1]|uniref:Efflux transporter, RND family, MFP subunit n=1 Tax=Desulforamulus reducens (strain ATCC BAA-1160 / DSM 100696 / MI-1) TaxID=349161 RepID=A4J8Q4_DESRM|nr:efflux RND transporter periplasmic adaptor subunit [Desulforamulus reducens]ABO51457.1 efflux transporter, RND family, MFP subunit [Desulforamulus reducens MI-1]